MTTIGEFSLKTSYAAQKQMAELAFALLQVQAATPAGEWVDERFGGEYREVWERARSLAGEEAAEDLVLALLTHAHVLLAYLVAATGIGEAEWLDRIRSDYVDRIRSDYVDRIPSSGTGVWGPRELRLGG